MSPGQTRPIQPFSLDRKPTLCYTSSTLPSGGAVAQLGERMTGSHEVVGSIPISSTNEIRNRLARHRASLFWFVRPLPALRATLSRGRG